jgi:hypothetical protein
MNDDWAVFVVVFFLGALFIGLIAAISGHEFPEQRMYKHCIEDGNTDYYCYHYHMTHTRSGKYD